VVLSCTQVSLLEGVQRKAIRFILGIEGRNSITEGRLSLEMELLELRRRNARMSLMLKFLSGSSHTPFIESFNQIQNNIHSYQTRSIFFFFLGGGSIGCVCKHLFYLHSFFADYRKIQVFFYDMTTFFCPASGSKGS